MKELNKSQVPSLSNEMLRSVYCKLVFCNTVLFMAHVCFKEFYKITHITAKLLIIDRVYRNLGKFPYLRDISTDERAMGPNDSENGSLKVIRSRLVAGSSTTYTSPDSSGNFKKLMSDLVRALRFVSRYAIIKLTLLKKGLYSFYPSMQSLRNPSPKESESFDRSVPNNNSNTASDLQYTLFKNKILYIKI
jgi:hypothetical protein